MKKQKKMPICYTLRLVDNKWYVGTAVDFVDRINDHRHGRSCRWTAKYPMIEVEDQYYVAAADRYSEENEQYMRTARLHGPENVRGGDVVCLQEPVPAWCMPQEFGGDRIVSWG